MISMLLLLLATPAQIGPEIFEGQCDYRGAPVRRGDQQVQCDSAVIADGRGPSGVIVQFVKRGSGGPIGFAGQVGYNGDIVIERVYLRRGVSTPASGGHCRLFDRGDTVTGITCIARVGARTVIANFRAFAP